MNVPQKDEPLYKCLLVTVAVLTLLLFIFTQFVNLASAGDESPIIDVGWFKNGIGEVSAEFDLDITPAGFTFSIWGVIYIWQAAWIIYVFTTFCRRNQYGAVFNNPPIVTPFFLMVYCFNLIFNILWLFLFDNKLIIWSFVALFLIFFTLDYPMLISLHLALDKYKKQLRDDHHKELLAIRILIQNGIVVYRTWVLIASILNFGFILTYEADVDQSLASTICLGILAFNVILDFIVDVIVWDRYLRYTFTHWGVYIWALIGVLAKNWDPNDRNSIISLILLLLCVILLIAKIPLVVWRHFNRPLIPIEAPSPSKIKETETP